MKATVRRSTVTSTHNRIELRREDIIGLLRTHWAKTRLGLPLIPEKAKVYVSVPGGGDWSNTSLDLDADIPLVVTWDETRSTEE